jgi:hypothetical protein
MNEQAARGQFMKASTEWLGRFGESFWSKIFVASGVHYVPLSKIQTGRAPAIVGATRSIVLPDFDIADESGHTAYVDSKAKLQSIIYRKANQERHGIDRRNFDAYIQAGLTFNKRCGIALLECFRERLGTLEWSGSLLVETLRNLGSPIPGTSSERHMVYWPRKVFVDLDSLDATEILNIEHGVAKRSYRHELRKVFFESPLVQQGLFNE